MGKQLCVIEDCVCCAECVVLASCRGRLRDAEFRGSGNYPKLFRIMQEHLYVLTEKAPKTSDPRAEKRRCFSTFRKRAKKQRALGN